MKGKLIVMEGVDCSGKATQTGLLVKGLRTKGYQAEQFSFPNYDAPTGKIIKGPYLGNLSDGKSWFEEGSIAVNPKVSALYYAADRLYNIHKITWLLDHGIHVILDRYVYSNMAYQGAKIKNESERKEMYQWLEQLEFELLKLPKPDIAIFLHVPTYEIKNLKQTRNTLDQNELDDTYLYHSENTYIELAHIYQFYTIECFDKNLRSIESIHDEIMKIIESNIKNA